MNSTVSSSLSLSDVIHGVRGSVGRWAVLGWISSVLGLLLYRRLGEILGRMERLAARFEAGRLRPLGPRVGERIWPRDPTATLPRSPTAKLPRDPTAKLPRDPTAKLPRRFGWLVRAASWHAGCYSGQLQFVLEQPRMVELLIAAPQAARVLTPLCRMLAVETALLRPRVVGSEAVAAVVPVVVKRVRAKRPAVDFGRIPIPRGVISAVRRRGLAKDG